MEIKFENIGFTAKFIIISFSGKSVVIQQYEAPSHTYKVVNQCMENRPRAYMGESKKFRTPHTNPARKLSGEKRRERECIGI